MRIPIIIRVANAADRSLPVGAYTTVRRSLNLPSAIGWVPDVVALSEVSSVDVAKMADDVDARSPFRGDLHVVQLGRRTSPEAGTALVSRLGPITDPRRVVGSRPTDEVRERSWIGGKVLGRRLWSGHGNPPRDPRGFARWFRVSRTLRGALLADWNQARGWMVARVTRKYVGDPEGVLGGLFPRSWRPSLIGLAQVGGDHPAVDIVVWLRMSRKRATALGLAVRAEEWPR